MRTERRQDLRTNDLQQQLDDVRQYVMQHAAMLTVVVVAAAIIVGGGFGYMRWQNSRQMEAWDAIDSSATPSTPEKTIASLEEVADKGLTPGLTVAALLKIGDTSLRESMIPEKAPEASAAPLSQPASVDWPAKARDAYTQVVNQHGDDLIAAGRAMMGLGVVAENQGDIEKARTWYKKIADDSRFALTPLVGQAKYRMSKLDAWAKPVVFPPAQMTVPIPEGMEAQAYAPVTQPATPPAAGAGAQVEPGSPTAAVKTEPAPAAAPSGQTPPAQPPAPASPPQPGK